MKLIHHGGHEGVTGSCHQLVWQRGKSLLVDCGIFQGDDAQRHPDPEINFSLGGIESLASASDETFEPVQTFEATRISPPEDMVKLAIAILGVAFLIVPL